MFFTDLQESIAEFASYKRLAAKKGSEVFKYIFLLLTILFAIKLVVAYFPFQRGLETFQSEAATHIPDFQITEGELSVSGEQPYRFEEQAYSIIIDTTGSTDASELEKIHEGLFIDKTTMHIKQNGRMQVVQFSDLGISSLSKADLIRWTGKLSGIYFLFALPWYIGFIIRILFAILILTLIALIISNSQKIYLDFQALWNISTYAMTLPLLLLAGVQILNSLLPMKIGIPFFGILRWLIAIFYVWKALNYIKEHPEPSFEDSDLIKKAD